MSDAPSAEQIQACDREPIHIPGAIQPHGALLVLDRDSLVVRAAAGDVAGLLGVEAWLDQTAGALIGDDLAGQVAALSSSRPAGGFIGVLRRQGRNLDLSATIQGDLVLLEIEPGLDRPMAGSQILAHLEAAAAAFERCPGLKTLYDRAALEFRRLTGFDRVMIYRFGVADEAGEVVGEDRAPHLKSFLNHRFPGSDIPRQARALYVRNLVRVIPDAAYLPAPLEPALEPALDMSDLALRSVSPVHLQYLRNMGVGASASVSIVKDGRLWGLVACHHDGSRLLPYEIRAACRALAGGLARQIKAKEEAEAWREKLRLRALGDDLSAVLAQSDIGDLALEEHLADLVALGEADGVALFRDERIETAGKTPPHTALFMLRDWLLEADTGGVVATDQSANVFPGAGAFKSWASGLMGVVIERSPLLAVLWTRAEEVEVVRWAGDPYRTAKAAGGDGALTPRASFDAWSETVRGRSRPWTPSQSDAAARLRQDLLDLRRARRTAELNSQLRATLDDKDDLLRQKDFLLREVNHRVQNSLALAAGFLTIQMKAIEDPAARAPLEEASRRLTAVGLVHRRLYRGDQLETVSLDRYLVELAEELVESLGQDWARMLRVDAAPATVSTDKAVTIGLVVTELVINAVKYAYGGRPGRIDIGLVEQGGRVRLSVADQGGGKQGPRVGFGSKMMDAMVRQLAGTLTYNDNSPGVRAELNAPAG
ncbi:histidine kinase dimerization/phosphoacceptor domain -containing protein [Caulobacter hibisci]|uniref:GAF domain-containing protein n=1 Tax=Caulobacter hibisci TaxID=2035993 RepID=A0ABS0T0J6_9CAUL|nr:histidine kinase dimerization/phosphoacceptor domain -containing protein [Caulobacter hibisci]MBI1684630.1 GAF domain-containing protein [Caulobacter hibisci]